MKTLTMFDLQRVTKRLLLGLKEPALVMAGPENEKKPIAALVPYEMYLTMQTAMTAKGEE